MIARINNIPFANILGVFGEDVNKNGAVLREFVTFNELKIINTFFHKKVITNTAGQLEDFDLI